MNDKVMAWVAFGQAVLGMVATMALGVVSFNYGEPTLLGIGLLMVMYLLFGGIALGSWVSVVDTMDFKVKGKR